MIIEFSLEKICSVIKQEGRISIVQNAELDPLGEHDVGFMLVAHTANQDFECLLYEENMY